MIEVRDIKRFYQVGDQEVRALDGVSFRIEKGEYVSLMGPSGSGKSTLLHCLGLLDRPTEGHYLIDERDTVTLDEEEQARTRRERIGFVFQFFHLVSYLTAFENVELPLTLSGVPAAMRRERVEAALSRIGLEERMDHIPDQLSGGQRQRVAIARAIVTDPTVLLADEPTGNLDRRSGDEVIGLLEELNASGITLVVVTHDADLGGRARRRLRLADGLVVSDEKEGL
ncbi:MAG: ABC transporter ATP-binding protein [Candidatus Binatia bacterium]|nr:ABC transporter ATP-binding protein [Candidatus Binatia bacterium]MDG2011333.1 ABC transporter ATP-binding protein [Candidatus Binatia bacterium]HAC81451.1 macrolide ABC transporter ATP-binding protein [Deltaproteobacteria bacterium]